MVHKIAYEFQAIVGSLKSTASKIHHYSGNARVQYIGKQFLPPCWGSKSIIYSISYKQHDLNIMIIKQGQHTLLVYQNCFIPITDFANDLFFKVASPKSPILTLPVVPVMNILSHFRSRWIMGGVLECRKLKPFSICRHHDFKTLGFIFLNLLRYLKYRNRNFNSISYVMNCLIFISTLFKIYNSKTIKKNSLTNTDFPLVQISVINSHKNMKYKTVKRSGQ